MSYAMQLHEAHVQRRARLWPSPRPVLRKRVPPPPVPRAEVRDYLFLASTELPEIPNAFRWRYILKEVAEKHGLAAETIVGECRSKNVVRARHEVCYRLSTETGLSLSRIGRKLNRDHTSVLHGIRRHLERMEGAEA